MVSVCFNDKWKKCPSKPFGIGHFRFNPYFSTGPSLKSGLLTLTKITVLDLSMIGLSFYKVLYFTLITVIFGSI